MAVNLSLPASGKIDERLKLEYPHPFTAPLHERTSRPPEGQVEDAKTLAELRMIKLSWAIRGKKDWQSKLKQPEILKQWKAEATSQQEHLLEEEKLTENMINYVFTELKAYARLTELNTGIQHACNDATFSTYNLIPDEIARELRDGVAQIEDVPDDTKDWHPGSDGQVLDLVHPSLYCIVYGQTLMRHSDGSLTEIAPPPDESTYESEDPFVSHQFAWLPSDFAVDMVGGVRLVSPYINNLHKSNEGLYIVIPKILGHFIPMFERVLGAIGRTDDGERSEPESSDDLSDDESSEPGSPVDLPQAVPTSGRIRDDAGGSLPCIWGGTGIPLHEDETIEYEDERFKAWIRTQPMTLPESPEKYQGALESAFRPADLRGRTLQCIVKLANIHLTPEKPSYPGGSWHVEGMLNERIVATGIYYYDSENLSDSQLEFRTSIREPEYHEQDDSLCMQILFGLDRDEALVQQRGSITTSAGLALAFPNIYQHCVSPFHLADPSKPGHRKILAFFLVDPNYKVPSASDVAPQQEEWMLEFMQNVGPEGIQGTYLAMLPVELRRMVTERTKVLMNKDEANSIRERLMKERSKFVDVYDQEVMQVTFNMCEH